MTTLRVALLQLAANGADQDANAAKGEAACQTARQMGADIALFPEMWNIGYSPFWPATEEPSELFRAPSRWSVADRETEREAITDARSAWQAQAIRFEDPFVQRFCALAGELDMAIALTFLEQWPGAPRNTLCLIDRHGEIALTYAKVHTCSFSLTEGSLTAGEDFPVCTLDTAAGPVAAGAMICFDREFPESARALMLGGAELVLVPNACEMEMHRIGQLRCRAWENQLAVALANYPEPEQNGHSVAFDPMVFDELGHSRDNLVIEAGNSEGIYLAKFDLAKLRDYREREAMGDAFRRPHLYSSLTKLEQAAPFVRVDRNGTPFRPILPMRVDLHSDRSVR